MKVAFLIFLLVLQQSNEVSSVTEAQQKCAELVYKWLTDMLNTDQILKVLVVIQESVYQQKPTKNITNSVINEILKTANSFQAAKALSAYSKLRNDLGNDADNVENLLWSNLFSVLDEVFDKLKARSKKVKKSGKSKDKVLNQQYLKLNTIVQKKVQKAFDKCSAAIQPKYWKIIVADFGSILNFDQYTK